MPIWRAIPILLMIAGWLGRGSPSTPETDAGHFRRLEENRGYVEQCRVTNLWKDRLARVNVFAFLDPSWYYSYRQAIMLKLLKKRLDKSGFTNISFFAVTPTPDLPEDNTENSIEIKTWREISKNIWKSDYFFNIEESVFDDSMKDENDIVFLQDNPELNIWENFRALKDEVIVVDRCGKLTYQVIIPWSILYFPYVKAAILSTYQEDPCGPCDVQPSLEHDSMDYEEYLLKNMNLNEKETENLDTSTLVPLSMNPSMISDIKVTTVETETHTYSNFDDKNQFDRNMSMKDVEIDTTPEISTMETTESYKETEDRILLNKQINTDSNNSFSTINNMHIDKEANNGDRRNELLVELQGEDHNATNEEVQNRTSESLPLRIILYAPHLHQEGETLKKYTHLILKTGSPDYHDHFNSKDTVSDEEPVTSKKLNTMTLDDQKLTEYMDSKNESPGVYGEIADYWRTQDDDEVNNKNENTEFIDYDDATVDDTGSNVNDAFDSESSIVRPSVIDDKNVENNDDTNDFAQQRLIEHYNKLLTWIYYII